MKYLIIALSAVAAVAAACPCAAEQRYFFEGDGRIDIASAKSNATFEGRYVKANGNYDNAALLKINRVFGAPADVIEPRFIAFLDYLQDHFNGGTIRVTSGYRSPSYNHSLRTNGALAGKASMHQYGMAADIRMKGVGPEKIWEYVRELGYGGVGYYHGANTHVDVGPARFWDETSSKVDTDHADDNKLIALIQDRDIYAPGDEIAMRFVRMTAYPIDVHHEFELEKQKGNTWKKSATFTPQFDVEVPGACPAFSSIDEMKNVRWRLPPDIKPGRYRIHATFCNKRWETMPDSVFSYEFVVADPRSAEAPL